MVKIIEETEVEGEEGDYQRSDEIEPGFLEVILELVEIASGTHETQG
jgi:hypothetical protein